MANNFPTIKPSLNLQLANTGILPPDVTFTRASQSGGYYDGKTVVKAEENLLIRSQEFDNAGWTKTNTTITANTTVAPDGTTTADTLTASAGNSVHQVNGTSVNTAVIGQVITQSVFVKKGTLDFVQITPAAGASDMFANFNMTTGAVEVTGAGLASASSVTVGDFYRIIITFTANSIGNSQIIINMINASTSTRSEAFDAAGTETVILWGAQLERRDSVTAYTPTTTQPITRFQPKLEYAIANEAVFDHNPVTGEALGLSIFEARTNLFLRSEEFDNAFWTKRNTTVSANQIIAPDGTLTMDKLVEDTSTGLHDTFRGISLSAVAHTFSVFAKAAERSYIWVRNSSVGSCFGEFDLLTGQISQVGAGATAKIENVGNGLYRCSITFTAIAGGNVLEVKILSDTNVISYTGDGVSGIYIWGAQLEAGAFATPYIPTVASTVARVADAAVMTGANFSRWFRADEGTFVVDSTFSSSATSVVTSVNDTTANNRIDIRQQSGNSLVANTNGVTEVFATSGAFAGNFVNTKIAGSYRVNDYAVSGNGSAVSTDTLASVPVVTQFQVGRTGGATAFTLNGYIKSLQFYPKALPLNLQAMTA